VKKGVIHYWFKLKKLTILFCNFWYKPMRLSILMPII